MHEGDNEERYYEVLEKYEAMLQSNKVLFFDANDFEFIIHYYMDHGMVQNAKNANRLGLSQHPLSIALQLLEVEILTFENKLEKAQLLLSKIQDIDPENSEVHIQKASILSKQSLHSEAVIELKKALYLTEDRADVLALLGMEYLFIDDFENAKSQFYECLKLDPEDYSALYNSINCYVYLDDPKGAIVFLNEFLETNPYCEIAWHQLGLQYSDLEDYKNALTSFDFAIISDDTFVGAYIEKAKVLEKFKRYEEAIELYTLTLSLEDPTSYAYLRIGKCYEKLQRRDKALVFFNKAVDEDPLLDKGWLAITDYYKKSKEYLKALYYINKAIDIDAENSSYWKNYAVINKLLGFYEESERGYRKAIEFGDVSLQNWLDRSDVLWLIGEKYATIVCLEQALEYYAENVEILYRLAGINFDMNFEDKATTYLSLAFEIDAEFKIIIEELFPQVLLNETVKQIFASYSK